MKTRSSTKPEVYIVADHQCTADYPLGRIGSCLRHGMVRGPSPFIVNFFKYLINVHVFVKQHKLVDLVQYIVLVELKVFFFVFTV